MGLWTHQRLLLVLSASKSTSTTKTSIWMPSKAEAPHETPKRDGTVDPVHVSGVVYGENNRLTSFHAYKDGRVIFSKKYPEVNVRDSIRNLVQIQSANAQASLSATQATTSSSVQAAPNLTWQINNNVPEYWDGSRWVPAQYNSQHGMWMYVYNSAWYYYG
jgi:hypothetical protein